MNRDTVPANGPLEPPVIATPVHSPLKAVHSPLEAVHPLLEDRPEFGAPAPSQASHLPPIEQSLNEPASPEAAAESTQIDVPAAHVPSQIVHVAEVAPVAKVTNESTGGKGLRWYQWPGWLLCRTLDVASLLVLLAVVAAIPLVQLASLGYLLHAAGNLANGKPWSTALPGLKFAGKLGTFALLAALLWLPVFLVTDLAYSAQLLQPGSSTAQGWRIASFLLTAAWVIHIGWAACRGGRWWHLLWPAPFKFIRTSWRPATWRQASDQLYETVRALHFVRLWWLGARGAVAALVLVAVPVSMMIIGLRATELNAAGLVGLLGALGMLLVMLYLPFSQVQLAMQNRFLAAFDWISVRRRFRYAPIAHALALLLLCVLCIPLYLLRIEATPAELVWAPSLVFVAFMLPAKLVLGTAMGYAETRRDRKHLQPRRWWLRWPARTLAVASAMVYVGSLYVAQLIAGQGAYVMYFQHALLVPAPLISSQ